MKATLAVIAGSGTLPVIVAEEARRQGYSVIYIALDPIAEHPVPSTVRTVRVNVGRFGKLLKILRKEAAQYVVMAGKVPKSLMYRGSVVPDIKALQIMMKLKDRSDDTIMLTVVKEIEAVGLKVLNTTDFTTPLMAPEGCITRRKPQRSELEDIEFGLRMAKEVGRLDIGQTVVVKNTAVMAVEAIEGTDEAIKRGGRLAGPGAVVVKVSKPGQDLRFDVPVAGVQTVESMVEVGASVLAVEAGHVILLQREEMISLADRAGISIVGVKYSDRDD